MSHIIKIVFRPLQQLHQVSRRARLEPVIAELPVLEGIQQAERIINARSFRREVITVVILLQSRQRRLIFQAQSVGQRLDILFQLTADLHVRHATDIGVGVEHRNVLQVVEIAEDAHLPELRHARQQGETDAAVHRLQYPIEGFQGRAHLFLKRLVVKGLQERLVVLVDQDNHPAARPLISPQDNAREPERQAPFRRIIAIKLLPSGDVPVQYIHQIGRGSVFGDIQVQMEDRMLQPFLLEGGHRQPLEQILFPLEIGLYRRNQQALAKTAGAAQEIITSRCHHLVDQGGLVNIKITLLADLLEILDTDGIQP